MPIRSQGVKIMFREWNGYKIFEDGSIIAPTGNKLSPTKGPKEYAYIRVKHECGKWKTMFHHKLVALAWLGERPDGFEIDHKNNIRYDNRPENLQYVSKKFNRVKSYKEGFRYVKGEKNANSIYTEADIDYLCYKLDEVYKVKNGKCKPCVALSSRLNIKINTVRHVWCGLQWRHISNKYSFSSRFRD